MKTYSFSILFYILYFHLQRHLSITFALNIKIHQVTDQKLTDVSKNHLDDGQVLIVGLSRGLRLFMRNYEVTMLKHESCQIVAFARKGPIFVANAQSISRYFVSDTSDVSNVTRFLSNGTDNTISTIIRDPIAAFALDDIGKKLYWVSSNEDSSSLKVANFDGSHSKTLLHKSNRIILPNTLAVDSQNCRIFFFTEPVRGPPRLEMVTLDGRNLTVLHVLSSDKRNLMIRSVTLDTERQIIYWLENQDKKNFVQSFSYGGDFSGGNSVRVLNLPDAPSMPVSSLFFSRRRLLWASQSDWIIRSCPVDSDVKKCSNIFAPLPDLRDFVLLDDVEFNGWPQGYTDVCQKKSCSHLCFRTTSEETSSSSFRCDCPNGYLMKEDRKSCYNYFHKFLVVGFGEPNRQISLVSLDTQEFEPVGSQPLKKNWLIERLAFDPIEQCQYWIESDHMRPRKRISWSLLNSSAVGTLYTFSVRDEMPIDLSVDWVGRNIYWITEKEIVVSRINRTHQTYMHLYIKSFPYLTAIEVDPLRGRLYWTGSGNLFQSNLDGSEAKIILDNLPTHCCMLSLNPDTGDLFYAGHRHTRKGLGVIRRSPQTHQSFAYREMNTLQFLSIACIGDRLYWFSVLANKRFGSISTSGDDFVTLRSSLGFPVSAVGGMHNLSQPLPDSPCLRDNGGCAHLCFWEYGNVHKCACANHYQLQGKSCIALSSFLIFGIGNVIGRLTLLGGDFLPIHMSYPLQGVGYVTASIEKNAIYWVDFEKKQILGSEIDGSNVRVIVSGLYEPQGIAVDWEGGQLFFIDQEPWNRIEMISLMNPSFRRVIFDLNGPDNLESPMDLVFNPHHFILCWLDAKYRFRGSIRCLRFSTAGHRWSSSVKPTVSKLVADLANPRGITIDTVTGRIYYADMTKRLLGSVDMYGDRREEIELDEKYTPFSVAFFNNSLYFSDHKTHDINRILVNPITGKFLSPVANLAKRLGSVPLGMQVLDKNKNKDMDLSSGAAVCKQNDCEELCIMTKRLQRVCVCTTFHNSSSSSCRPPDHFIQAVASDGSIFTTQVHGKSDSMFYVQYHESRDLLKNVTKIQYRHIYKNQVNSPILYFYLVKLKGIVACNFTLLSSCKLIIPGNFVDFVFDDLEDKFFVIDSSDYSIKYFQYISDRYLDGVQISRAFVVVNCTEELCMPTSLTIDPIKSKLFWIDAKAGFMESFVDGTTKKLLLSNRTYVNGSSFLYYFDSVEPNPQSGIYWIRKHKLGNSVFFRELKSNSRPQIIVDYSLSHQVCAKEKRDSCRDRLKNLKLKNPLSISGFQHSLYILDSESKLKIFSRFVPSEGHLLSPPAFKDALQLTAMTVVSRSRPSHSDFSPCHCSHLCIREYKNNLLSKRCTCPAYMQIAPGSAAYQCQKIPSCNDHGKGQFSCGSRGQCVSLERHCNGHVDCEDGSDEWCCSDSFACRSRAQRRCVRYDQVCDGTPHCADGSDEMTEACSWVRKHNHKFPSREPHFPEGNQSSMSSVYSTYWPYILFGAILLVFVALIGYCCSREKPPMTLSVDPSVKLIKVEQPSAVPPALNETQFFSLPNRGDHSTRRKRKSKPRRRLHSSPAVSDYECKESRHFFVPPSASQQTYSEYRFSEAPGSYIETLNPPPSPCTDCSSLPGAKAAATEFLEIEGGIDGFYGSSHRSLPKRRRRKRNEASGQRRRGRGTQDPFIVPPPSPSSSVFMRPASFFQKVPPPTPQRVSLVSGVGLETDI